MTLYFNPRFITVVWNWTCNVSKVCLYWSFALWIFCAWCFVWIISTITSREIAFVIPLLHTGKKKKKARDMRWSAQCFQLQRTGVWIWTCVVWLQSMRCKHLCYLPWVFETCHDIVLYDEKHIFLCHSWHRALKSLEFPRRFMNDKGVSC